MKYILCLAIFLVSTTVLLAQDLSNASYDNKVQSLDSTIKTLYSIISGPKDKERNWQLFKFLFKDDAEITIFFGKSPGNGTKYYLKVDDYINTYGKWLEQNGYYAKETDRTISTFRHLNHVSSTYQNNLTNRGTYQGLNSINLVKEDNRWFISNLKWNQEVDDHEVLKEYLPNSQN